MHTAAASVPGPLTDIPFSYTVGLTALQRPELLLAGLTADVAHVLLNQMAGRVHHTAQQFADDQLISDLLTGYDAVIIDGDLTGQLRPSVALARYDDTRVRLQQIVWPDVRGRFPWDPGYGYAQQRQPLIARRQPPGSYRSSR